MLEITFGGAEMDLSVPRFVELGFGRVIDRLDMQMLDEASLQAQMAAENYTAKANEIGADANWLSTHTGPWTSWAAGAGAGGTPVQPPAWQAPTLTPVTGLPATGDAAGSVTVTMDISFHGQDIPTGGKTATITYDIGAGDQTVTAALAAGDTPNQATAKIVAAIDGVTGLGAVKATGTTITVTPDDQIVLSKLELAVA